MTSDEQRRGPGDFDPTSDKIKVVAIKCSNGLKFPVVAQPGVGHMPAKRPDVNEAARVFYVAATWAMQRLVITASRDDGFGKRLG